MTKMVILTASNLSVAYGGGVLIDFRVFLHSSEDVKVGKGVLGRGKLAIHRKPVQG